MRERKGNGLVIRAEVDVVETEVVETHFFEAEIARDRGELFAGLAPRAFLAARLLLARIHVAKQRFLRAEKNRVRHDPLLQLDYALNHLGLAALLHFLRLTSPSQSYRSVQHALHPRNVDPILRKRLDRRRQQRLSATRPRIARVGRIAEGLRVAGVERSQLAEVHRKRERRARDGRGIELGVEVELQITENREKRLSSRDAAR